MKRIANTSASNGSPPPISSPARHQRSVSAPSPRGEPGPTNAQVLHRDGLGSVRAITNPAGARIEGAVYKPYGEQTETVVVGTQLAEETKGWIGERFDEDAGLQYLNARYYDPELGMFLQPDWWEVTKRGVGTNRYAYSFGDPVNKMDPGGNVTVKDGARLSDAVYVKGRQVPGFERLDKASLERIGLGKAIFENDNGLKAGLFRNKKTNEYTLAFAGTEDGKDWWNGNIPQSVGASSQYRDAVRLAREVSRAVGKIDGADLSFVGHSMGGGQAANAAWSITDPRHMEAKTYNAAGVSIVSLALSAQVVFESRQVDNYFVGGDALSSLSIGTLMPDALGEQHRVFVGPDLDVMDSPMNLHSMTAVFSALRNSDYWDQ